jgi:hypothetical protein
VPSAALLHHAQLAGLDGGADGELELGAEVGAWPGGWVGPEDWVGADGSPGGEVTGLDGPAGAEVTGADEGAEVPSVGAAVLVPADCTDVEVPCDGLAPEVGMPRHPTASRGTNASTAIFRDAIARQVIPGRSQRSQGYANKHIVYTLREGEG